MSKTVFGWGPVTQTDTSITFRGIVAPGTDGAVWVEGLGGKGGGGYIGDITMDTTGYEVELTWFVPQFESSEGFLYNYREPDTEIDPVEIVLKEVTP